MFDSYENIAISAINNIDISAKRSYIRRFKEQSNQLRYYFILNSQTFRRTTVVLFHVVERRPDSGLTNFTSMTVITDSGADSDSTAFLVQPVKVEVIIGQISL